MMLMMTRNILGRGATSDDIDAGNREAVILEPLEYSKELSWVFHIHQSQES